MPINYALYPKDWKAIRERILARAQNACEGCGVRNHATGFRDKDGTFHAIADDAELQTLANEQKVKPFRIVLTIAHIDHDVQNNDESNLRAWCQRCHLTHDAQHHAANARRTRERKRGQLRLFEMEAGR
jgi:hypothetical protein